MVKNDVIVTSAAFDCRYCQGAGLSTQHLVDAMIHSRMQVDHNFRTEAVRAEIEESIRSKDPELFFGFGHGLQDIFTGNFENVVLNAQNAHLLQGKIVYLHSCLTGNRLGPTLIQSGAKAFIGYDDLWYWVADDINRDAYRDKAAEPFFRGAHEVIYGLLRGETVGQAYQSAINKYNAYIDQYDSVDAEITKYLLWDRDILLVLGDTSARLTELLSELPPGPEPTAQIYPTLAFISIVAITAGLGIWWISQDENLKFWLPR